MSDSGGTSPPPTEVEQNPELAAFTRKLNKLFRTVRPDGGDVEYPNKEVAAAIGISDAQVSYLRRGKRGIPRARILRALEKFFGARKGYLDPDADPTITGKVDQQLAMIDWLRENGLLQHVINECVLRLETHEAEADIPAAS
ncbi:helix-turn-helix domain-containing protein [Amycolatopsis coloradensis]|nr:helix-turn-helix transcriptional regulator [Amycolatopsis coloradensis]